MKTNKEYIKQAKEIHGCKYDYSLVNYVRGVDKIKIICSEHGLFEQRAFNHLSGHGCPVCGRNRITLSPEEFITRSKKIHNDKYDYSKVIYVNHMTKVVIICPVHGEFKQRPNDHLTGYNCTLCANEEKSSNMTSTTEIFIEKAKKLHGERYDYSKVNYINSSTNVEIICKHHGIFLQTPNNHLHKDGCSQCGYKISFKETAWLDSLNLPNDKNHRQCKIEINGRKIQVDGFDSETNTIYEYYGDFWHGNPNIYKSEEVNPINKKSYGPIPPTLCRHVNKTHNFCDNSLGT